MTRETEPDNNPCWSCDGTEQITVDPTAPDFGRTCPCVAMQALPDLWRPARYFCVDGGPLSRGLVFVDLEDFPRRPIHVGFAPDVPDWWRDPRPTQVINGVAVFLDPDSPNDDWDHDSGAWESPEDPAVTDWFDG